MNKYIDLLMRINDGQLIPNIQNEDALRNLFSKEVALFKDIISNKYYFFAEYLADENNEDNMADIEKQTILNHEAFAESIPSPSDSYLILFWKVEEINDRIISKVIELEENEFLYKKYVIYFTADEMTNLIKWMDSEKYTGIQELLSGITKTPNLPDYLLFLIRIFIKVPFWNLDFSKSQMKDFESMVCEKLSSGRTADKDDVIELKDQIDAFDSLWEKGEDVEVEAEKIVDSLFEKIV